MFKRQTRALQAPMVDPTPTPERAREQYTGEDRDHARKLERVLATMWVGVQ